MRELAVQERDITINWRGNTGRMLSVKLKKIKTLEAWVNKLITPENIQEIETLRIIKHGRSLDLQVDHTRSMYRPTASGSYKAPVFYIKTLIDKAEFEQFIEEGGRRA